MENLFRNPSMHIHRLEGLKKLANKILDAFRGVICI